MIVYLSCAMDRANTYETARWARRMRHALREGGVSCFAPQTAYTLARDASRVDCQSVVAINERALWLCDALLLRYQPDVPSVGVPVEMAAATKNSLPIVLLVPDLTWVEHALQSVYLRAMLDPDLIVPQTECLDELFAVLQRIDQEQQAQRAGRPAGLLQTLMRARTGGGDE